MTYVAARLQLDDSRPVKLLVVDADLEAPGSDLLVGCSPTDPRCLLFNFLEAMHFPPSSVESSLEFFAQSLRKTSLNVSGTQRELFCVASGTGDADRY